MKKYLNYIFFSAVIYILLALFLLIGRFLYHRIIAGEICIVIYSALYYIVTNWMYRKHLKIIYPRDYINIGQNHFGRIPLGIIGQDMDVSPFVPDSYDDRALTRLKLQYKYSLSFIIGTLLLIMLVN